jgi:hypothetical protein
MSGTTFPISSAISGEQTTHLSRIFPREQRRDFTIRRKILWVPDTTSRADVSAKDVAVILPLHSNEETVGYNQWPKFRKSGAM